MHALQNKKARKQILDTGDQSSSYATNRFDMSLSTAQLYSQKDYPCSHHRDTLLIEHNKNSCTWVLRCTLTVENRH